MYSRLYLFEGSDRRDSAKSEKKSLRTFDIFFKSKAKALLLSIVLNFQTTVFLGYQDIP